VCEPLTTRYTGRFTPSPSTSEIARDVAGETRSLDANSRYAARYLKLSERAKDPARRQRLASLALTWIKLAAELESDQALLNALSEINVDEPFYAVPEALNLRAA
jgi:hypothetical protein